jgi:hypothetical protein
LWSSDPPGSLIAFFNHPFRPDAGRRLWIFLTPTTTLITIINLLFAFFSHAPRRTWWLGSALCSLFIMAVTFAYFVPVLLSFPRAAEKPASEVVATARRWVALNYIRALLLVAAWLAALKAFSYRG